MKIRTGENTYRRVEGVSDGGRRSDGVSGGRAGRRVDDSNSTDKLIRSGIHRYDERRSFDRTWVRRKLHPELWSHCDNKGPRTTNAAEGWHNSLNTHFGTPHPSLRVILHWLATRQFEVQSRCIQLAAGRPPKQQRWNYAAVNVELWNAKVRYRHGHQLHHRNASRRQHSSAIYGSRMQFRAVTESYLRWCSHLFAATGRDSGRFTYFAYYTSSMTMLLNAWPICLYNTCKRMNFSFARRQIWRRRPQIWTVNNNVTASLLVVHVYV